MSSDSVGDKHHSSESRVILRFERFASFVEEYSSNISLGGVFIKTHRARSVGTEIHFEFKLVDGFRLLHGQGVVVWVRLKDAGEDHPAGMGVRFSAIDESGRQLVLKLLEEQVKGGGAPFEVEKIPADADGTAPTPAQQLELPDWSEDPTLVGQLVGQSPNPVLPDPVEPAPAGRQGEFNAPWGEHLPGIPTDLLDEEIDPEVEKAVRNIRPDPALDSRPAAREQAGLEDASPTSVQDVGVDFGDEEPTLVGQSVADPRAADSSVGWAPDEALPGPADDEFELGSDLEDEIALELEDEEPLEGPDDFAEDDLAEDLVADDELDEVSFAEVGAAQQSELAFEPPPEDELGFDAFEVHDEEPSDEAAIPPRSQSRRAGGQVVRDLVGQEPAFEIEAEPDADIESELDATDFTFVATEGKSSEAAGRKADDADADGLVAYHHDANDHDADDHDADDHDADDRDADDRDAADHDSGELSGGFAGGFGGGFGSEPTFEPSSEPASDPFEISDSSSDPYEGAVVPNFEPGPGDGPMAPTFAAPAFGSREAAEGRGPGRGAPVAPAFDAPAFDAPGFDAPAFDAPAFDAPAFEVPDLDPPDVDAPDYEAPDLDAPDLDAPDFDALDFEAADGATPAASELPPPAFGFSDDERFAEAAESAQESWQAHEESEPGPAEFEATGEGLPAAAAPSSPQGYFGAPGGASESPASFDTGFDADGPAPAGLEEWNEDDAWLEEGPKKSRRVLHMVVAALVVAILAGAYVMRQPLAEMVGLATPQASAEKRASGPPGDSKKAQPAVPSGSDQSSESTSGSSAEEGLDSGSVDSLAGEDAGGEATSGDGDLAAAELEPAPSETASAAPPSAQPSPSPRTSPAAQPSTEPARQPPPETRKTSETPAAARPPASTAGGSGRAAREVLDVQWQRQSTGTRVTILLDGTVDTKRFQHDALDWAADRERLIVRNVGNFRLTTIEVGTSELKRIRIGQHAGPELHFVFDLASPKAGIVDVTARGDRIEILLAPR